MQSAYVKTSLSLPMELWEYLKKKSEVSGGVPISRLVASAVKNQKDKESKKGGRK